MGSEKRSPWALAAVCGLCSSHLVAMSYLHSADDDPTRDGGYHPVLKCPGCSQRYQWQDSAGWVPRGVPGRVELVGTAQESEWSSAERQSRRVRRTSAERVNRG